MEIRNDVLARGTDDNGSVISSANRKLLEKDSSLVMVALGQTYTRQKKFDQAQDILLKALSLVQNSWGWQHDCTGVALAAFGDLKFAQGNYAQAESYYKQALAIRRKYHPVKDLKINNKLCFCIE